MKQIQDKIIENFGNKLRIRVCGLCIEDEKILMVNHHSLNKKDDFWAPPGGGMDFGQSAEENLKREFLEETGLTIEIEKFLFVHEYLSPPLHAIELIFKVKRVDGIVKVGSDPELAKDVQIIKNVKFIPLKKIAEIDKDSIHQMFLNVQKNSKIDNLKGYYLWNKYI
jgi:8-oxo-dGTP diphosphatase